MSNLTDNHFPSNTADAEDLAGALRQMFDLDAFAGPETDQVTVAIDAGRGPVSGGRVVADVATGDWAAYVGDNEILAEGESDSAVELGRHIRRVFGI